MLVKKELIINGKEAILSYDDTLFGKGAKELKGESYAETKLLFVDSKIRVKLLINSEKYHSHCISKNIPNFEFDVFFFEIADFDSKDNELTCSEAIYQSISNEEELLKLITKMSYFINNMDEFKECPKGFVAGYCDEKTSTDCEYSALTIKGLCGAECLKCGGDIHAYDKKGYSCSCSTILFEE